VVVFHRHDWGPGGHLLDEGYLAVCFFFMLSGFVIDHAYTSRLHGHLSFGRFAIIRTIRLYPMIIAGVSFGAALQIVSALHGHDMHGAMNYLLAALMAALCLPLPAFLGPAEPFFLDRPLWSLFYELIANVAYALFLYRLRVKYLLVLAMIGIFASVASAHEFGTILVGYRHGQLMWGLACVFPPFLIGMILNRIKDSVRFVTIPFWMATIVLLATFAPFGLGSAKPVYEFFAVLIVYPALILGAGQDEPDGIWMSIAKASAYISYPIYALHFPTLQLVGALLRYKHVPGFLWLPVATLACVLTAYIAGRIEQPMRAALAKWYNARSAAAGSGVDVKQVVAHPQPLHVKD
jgi:peptidoglycan/LPS O-acetylase OafA/YrhL